MAVSARGIVAAIQLPACDHISIAMPGQPGLQTKSEQHSQERQHQPIQQWVSRQVWQRTIERRTISGHTLRQHDCVTLRHKSGCGGSLTGVVAEQDWSSSGNLKRKEQQ